MQVGDNQALAQAPTSVALSIREDLTRDEWITLGQQLGRSAQGVQWFIGDWLNYGFKKGFMASERYELAEEITHMTKPWLYRCAWVAGAIAPEDRRIELSFDHHTRIASIKPGIEREVLMQVAVQEGMSAKALYALASDVLAPALIETPVQVPVVVDDSSVVLPDLPEIGQVFELGQHRLVVGDSTDPNTWKALFNGHEHADIMWTDPPYGVDYVGKTAEELTIQGDSSADIGKMLVQAFGLADLYLKDGSPLYVASGYRNMHVVVDIMSIIEWRFSTELIWVKNNLAIGWGDYHPKHESLVYGFKGQSATRRWYGPRNRSTVFGLTEVGDGALDYTIPMPQANDRHPTMKPPKLIFEHLRNSALHGHTVVDPFAGSGSTMIAAEQMGMQALMIELEPKYAKAIIDRYHTEIVGKA